jgi:glucose-6-phosphate isomerase
MESLGKHPNKNSKYQHTGQIIFGGYGPTAQHSYFQLLHQGTQSICADIIACIEDVNSLAYAQAITQTKLLSSSTHSTQDLLTDQERINGNIPVNLFLLKKIDSFSLGYLIATWEHRTFITATMLQINPFDQFGVSAGKIYTKKFLQGHET